MGPNPQGTALPLTRVFYDEGLDLSIGLAESAENVDYCPFQLDPGTWMTRETAMANIGGLTVIHGEPKFQRDTIEIDGGSIRSIGFTYTAAGPITEITNDRIISDFAEREVLRNGNTQRGAPAIELTGGARDIGGMSGSGVWAIDDGGSVIFCGIISGLSEDNIDATQHLVCSVPAWIIIDRLCHIITPS